MVAIYHFTGWKWSDTAWFKWSSLIINGSDAVAFFFVLSGFVLSYKYFHKGKEVKPLKFFAKRLLRLYPAYILTVLICYAYYTRAAGLDGFLSGFLANGDSKILSELFMIRQSHLYYTPGWSLGVEMGLSVLLPLLVFACKSNIKYTYWLSAFAIFIGPHFVNPFIIHFTLGALISFHYYDLINKEGLGKKVTKYFSFLLPISILLFSARHINKLVSFGTETELAHNFLKVDFFLPTGIGAALLMTLVISSKNMRAFFTNRLFFQLGKISYSIYLCHWIIVWSLMDNYDFLKEQLSSIHLPELSVFALYLAGVLLVSYVFYYLVERPFIQLSRRLFS